MGRAVVMVYSVPRSVLPVNENQEAGRRFDLIEGMRVGFHRGNEGCPGVIAGRHSFPRDN
jgi:hypothetical protein